MDTESEKINRSFLFLLTEQLLVFPISFVLLKLFKIELTTFVYAFLFLFGYTLIYSRIRMSHVKRQRMIIISLPVILLTSLLLSSFTYKMIAIFAMGIFVLVRALWITENPYNGFSFYSFVAAGIIAYIISALFLKNNVFAPYMVFLSICATISIILACVCMNMAVIGYERTFNNKTISIPALSKSSNRILLIVFACGILLFSSIGFIDVIARFLGTIFKTVILNLFNWVNGMLTLTPQELPPTEEPTPLPEDNMELPPQTSPFMETLENILKIAAIVGFTLFILFMLFLLFRYLVKNYRKIYKLIHDRLKTIIDRFLKGRGQTEDAQPFFEDEVSSLLEKNETILKATGRWLKAHVREDHPYMLLKENREKARWLYARTIKKEIKKGHAINKAMSPVEALNHISQSNHQIDPTLTGSAVSCYEKARYSENIPTDADLEALKAIYSSKSPRV